MQDRLKKFALRLTIFSIFISVISTALFSFFLQKYYLPVFPFVIVFFYALTLLIHWILLKSSQQRFARFSANFMLSTSLKLFFYIIFLLIYVFVDRINAVPFIIEFVILYFLFTTFEVISILSDLKE